MREDQPVNRRRFFREGLRELLKPLAGAVEPLHEAVKQLERLDSYIEPYQPPPAAKTPPIERWLRPPGALDERSFLDTCSRCGKCAEVCPAHCIKLDPAGILGNGAPHIQPDVMACVACEGLVCMPACPTGALIPTALNLINMGTAVWNEYVCVRSRGEDCKICVEKCPLGSVAIELIDNRIEVHEKGCIGCGVCQHECPTSPKSITVIPKDPALGHAKILG